MAAPKNNKNAQRWTHDRVVYYLQELEKAANENGALFWGKELERLGLYKDVWAYWKRKFADDEVLLEYMELIETIYEVKLVKAAFRSEIAPGVAIVCLKRIYGWRDDPCADNVTKERSNLPTEMSHLRGYNSMAA